MLDDSGRDITWRGRPSAARIRTIQLLTDSIGGKQVYKLRLEDGWRRLRTPADFEALNDTLDRMTR